MSGRTISWQTRPIIICIIRCISLLPHWAAICYLRNVGVSDVQDCVLNSPGVQSCWNILFWLTSDWYCFRFQLLHCKLGHLQVPSWSHALFREGNIPSRGDSPNKQHSPHLRKMVPTVGILMGVLIVCLLLQCPYPH